MNSFMNFMSSLYLYMKAAHLIAAFAWMAGMFYLPRLFAYHAQAGVGTPQAEAFKTMERRLLRTVMNPAMVVTIGFGIWMVVYRNESPGWWASSGWLHAKLLLVALLVVIHGFLAKWRKDFEAGRIPHGSRFFRVITEAPSLLLAGIVILVIVQPF
ncbi:MAG: protoporphyrinogen oxidase HemJ [Rhodomicrobium sp.]|jgi:protoporphyrinogen IX oxidase